MRKINVVTILGANGSIGSLCGGLIAAFGDSKVFMVSRSLKKANYAITKAIESVKSDSIRRNLVPIAYSDLPFCLSKSDWVLEACSESLDIKHSINKRISKYVKQGAIITSTTSSLSISTLASDFSKDIQKNYFGTHFFNPPYRMLLCEVICNSDPDKKTLNDLIEYLEKVLYRKVIISKDQPAFIGNKIAFDILNEALIYGQKYGFTYIDYLLGGVSGRVMPPIKTIELIGLDTYRAIIKEIGLKVEDCVNKLVAEGKLGNKTGGSLYESEKNKSKNLGQFNIDLIADIKEKIREGRYREAYSKIINSSTQEANIVQYFWAKYICLSYSVIGTVADTAADVDIAMGYGFNWLPPSALIDLIGGKNAAIKLLIKFKMPTPKEFSKYKNSDVFYSLQNTLDYRTFLRAI